MNSSVSTDDIHPTIVSGTKLRIDGGTVFGVMPRVARERVSPPDKPHGASRSSDYSPTLGANLP